MRRDQSTDQLVQTSGTRLRGADRYCLVDAQPQSSDPRPGGTRREVAAAQSDLAALTGRPPRFFRAPAGIRSPFLDPVLHDLGLKLVSWTRRGFDTRQTDVTQVAALLAEGMGAGDILLMHDGNCARTPQGEPVVLQVLPGLIRHAQSLGLRPVTLEHAIAS